MSNAIQNDARELKIDELQDVSAGDRVLGDVITVWGGRPYINYEYNHTVGALLPVFRFEYQR